MIFKVSALRKLVAPENLSDILKLLKKNGMLLSYKIEGSKVVIRIPKRVEINALLEEESARTEEALFIARFQNARRR